MFLNQALIEKCKNVKIKLCLVEVQGLDILE